MLVAIVDALEVPIKFVGLGETPDALRPFVAVEFIDALFDDPPERQCQSCWQLRHATSEHLVLRANSTTQPNTKKGEEEHGSTRRTATRP